MSCVDGIGYVSQCFPSAPTNRNSSTSFDSYQDKLVPVPVGADGLGDVARVMLREIVGRQTGAIKDERWSFVVDC